MTPRGETLVDVLAVTSRPIRDLDARARALDATLDAIRLEGIGVESLDEWASRCNAYAATLLLGGRVHEARMVAAAARVLAA